MGLKFEDIKSLDKPYSQSIILYLYCASLVITLGTGILSMFEEGFTFFAFIRGLFIIVFGGIMCRLMAEAAQVLFRIEGHLRRIADQRQALSAPVSVSAPESVPVSESASGESPAKEV